MKVPDGLEALNFTKDDIGTLVKGALPQVKNIKRSLINQRGMYFFLIPNLVTVKSIFQYVFNYYFPNRNCL